MALDDIVSVTITTDAVRVSRVGFGTPLIAAFHTNWPERVRQYSASTALASMVTDGFATDDPAYIAASKILSQNPRPNTVKIGKRDNTWTQITRLTPDVPVIGDTYTVEILGSSIQVTATTTTVSEITGLWETAINAAVGGTVTAVDDTTHVTITHDTAAKVFDCQYVEGEAHNFSILDQTADSSPEDDMALIRAADPDFYGLVLDSPGTIDIEAMAVYAETQRVIFSANSADTDMLGGTGLGADLAALSLARTVLSYHPDATGYHGAAWLGRMLPFDPGSATWAYKTIASSAVYSLTATEEAALDADNVNHYLQIAGVNITRVGAASSGFFVDLTIGIDWLVARIQESVFALLASRPKLPYTDESVDLIRGQILARLQDAVNQDVIRARDSNGDPPSVTAPLVADVDPIDRGNRLLPDVFFAGELAGAIHTVQIQGNLSI